MQAPVLPSIAQYFIITQEKIKNEYFILSQNPETPETPNKTP